MPSRFCAHLAHVEAAQHVVGAELDDHPVHVVVERPADARQPAGGGVAGDAGVDHRHVRRAVRVQPGLELRHEALAPRAGRSPRSANRRRRGCAPRPPPRRPAPASAASASARLRIAPPCPICPDGTAACRGRVHMSSPVLSRSSRSRMWRSPSRGNAGPVNILRGVTLQRGARRDAGPRRAVGIGQVLAADADGRARGRDLRAGSRCWART